MLGVTFTSRAALDESETRRKKEKKDKKKKKEKRSKKTKHERRPSSNSSEDSASNDDGHRLRNSYDSMDDVPNTEAGALDAGSKPAAEADEPLLQREDWMTKPMKREGPSKATQEADEGGPRGEEEEQRKQAVAEPGVVAGLRIMKEKTDMATEGGPRDAVAAAAALGGGVGIGRVPGGGVGSGGGGNRGVVGGLVGDGGASWRLKALRRAQEQARTEGRSLQEVVGERWGSLTQLTGDLSSRVAADGKAHLRAAAERRRAAAEGAAPVVPHYLQDVRTDRAKMMRPADDASLSWRRSRDRDRSGRSLRPEDGPNGRDDDDGDRDRDGRSHRREDRPAGRDDGDRDRDGRSRRREDQPAGRDGDDRDRDGRRHREDRPIGRDHDDDDDDRDRGFKTRGKPDPRDQDDRSGPRDGDRIPNRDRERQTHGSQHVNHDERSSSRRRHGDDRGSRPAEQGRSADGDQDGAMASAEDCDRNRDWDADGEKRDRKREERDWERDPDRRRDWRQERRGERDRGRERDLERDREWEQERLTKPGRSGQQQQLGLRPSREQAAALQQLAGSLNTFVGDGSFMERFMASQQVEGGRQQQQKQQQRGTGQVKPEGPPDDADADGGCGRERDDDDSSDGGAGAGCETAAEGRAASTGTMMDITVGGTIALASTGSGPGPSSAGVGSEASRPEAPGVTGVTGGNRGIAAMLRAGRRNAEGGDRSGGCVTTATAGAGDGGGDGEHGGDGCDDGDIAGKLTTAASRRARLFVGTGEDYVGPGGGSGVGGGASAGGDGGAGGSGGNKSAAELLRARLKGLPLPAPSIAGNAATAAAAAGGGSTAAKREPAGSDGRVAPSGARRESADDSDGGVGHGGGGGKSHREVVQLPLVDAKGRAVRGAFGREAAGAGTAPNVGRRAGTKAPERYNRQTGEKERYFADDDKVDLQTMLRRAKYGDDDMDMDEHLAANISRKRKFRATDVDVDAEYDYDGGLELYESRAKRGNVEAQRSRERNQQVADLRRQSAVEACCMLCLNNLNRPKHLAIALGTCAYLSLPHRGRLVRGHCCIAPSEHCPSIRGLDEAAWTEVKNFIKCLIRMYDAQGQSVIFMETYMTRSGGRHHAVLDAVPVSERQLEKARGYFKKAILEAESEWSTHHAKACIETSAQKGLRESIPPNFPYFHVQFGYGSGYVHVIDNETKFDPNFGRQVLIGLLDLPPEMAFQRQKVESLATQQQWVREFEAQWDPYDWTRQLDAA